MTTISHDCSLCMESGTVISLVWARWYQKQANLDRDVNMYDQKQEHLAPAMPTNLRCYVCHGTGIQCGLELVKKKS